MLERYQPLPTLSEFLEGLTDVTQPVADEESGTMLLVDDMKVTLPFELGVEQGVGQGVEQEDADTVSLSAAPPTQQTETSIMPVWHSISVHVKLDKYSEHIADGASVEDNQKTEVSHEDI